jgi:hypothetical protein
MTSMAKRFRVVNVKLVSSINNFNDVMHFSRTHVIATSSTLDAEPVVPSQCLVSYGAPVDEELIFLPKFSPVGRATVHPSKIK